MKSQSKCGYFLEEIARNLIVQRAGSIAIAMTIAGAREAELLGRGRTNGGDRQIRVDLRRSRGLEFSPADVVREWPHPPSNRLLEVRPSLRLLEQNGVRIGRATSGVD
jgi:hypothetical protein